jgi:ribonuclease-3
MGGGGGPDAERGLHALAALLAALSSERRREVLTHRSWARRRSASYERLELLGDSVLQLVVTAEIVRRFPDATEGDLAWMRQRVVSREVCAEIARVGGLPDAMVEAAPAGVRASAVALAARPSVQAAVCEAVIGAGWLDLGWPEVDAAVLSAFAPALARAAPGQRDPKTALQEEAARRRLEVRYELTHEEGPAHARVFQSRVLVDGDPLGSGRGASKQASERAAAAEALERLRGGAPC